MGNKLNKKRTLSKNWWDSFL